MTFATFGSLAREDLETRAKNFLRLNITNKNGFLYSSKIDDEIEFLFNKGYILKKDGTQIYEMTEKGREYIR